MNTNEQQPDDKLTMKGSFNVLLYGAQVHAACVWPFLRLGMGVEALRWHGPAAFVLLCLLGCASQSMLIYLAVWLVFVARQRIKADPAQHSRYTGYPVVAIRIPGFRTEMKAKAAECLLCLLAGIALMPLDEAVGAFVAAGCFSLAIVEGIGREVNRMRVQRMRDAQIENQMLAERFRGQRHDY
ncbi:MAG TPA: hypothetical protein VGJ05_20580 [Fimbriiglobus sp.]|jgi:hypothetical protein